ncbi:hypothetical protein Hanom_Chr17g01566991 [Helianthus anomalus]
MNDKKKVSASRCLYISHIEGMENGVRLHKASANGSLKDILDPSSSNARCVEKLLAVEAAKGRSIFDELHGTYLLSKERLRFKDSIHHTTNISKFINGVFDKLM